MGKGAFGPGVISTAERRMFSKSIVNSARFLRMPQSSRLLYYDLGMAADDDGIVEAFTVIRTTGAAEDDLRVLAAKGFVTVLNDDLVSFIQDWNVNNQLRKDRYHPSLYAELLVKLGDGNQAATVWQPSGSQVETEVSIGKVSIGKASEGEGSKADKPPTRPRFVPPTLEEVTAYCCERKNGIDPEHFIDYYTARGWKYNGGQPVKDWRACVRTWEKNGHNRPQGTDRDRLRTASDYEAGEDFFGGDS